jgi:transposase-like protein
MARTHRAYPPELRQQTVELVQSGRTPDELARRYGLLEQIKTIWQSNREIELRKRAAPRTKIEQPRSRVQAPNQADKRGRAPTHEPCTGQEIVQAKARASARHTVTVIG